MKHYLTPKGIAKLIKENVDGLGPGSVESQIASQFIRGKLTPSQIISQIAGSYQGCDFDQIMTSLNRIAELSQMKPEALEKAKQTAMWWTGASPSSQPEQM